MATELLEKRPSFDDHVSLDEYISSTPASFIIQEAPILLTPMEVVRVVSDRGISQLVSESANSLEPQVWPESEIWVSSQCVTLWLTVLNKGLSIPYHSLSLHALVGSGSILLQFDWEEESITLSVDLRTEDAAKLVFEALTKGADMNPDAMDSDNAWDDAVSLNGEPRLIEDDGKVHTADGNDGPLNKELGTRRALPADDDEIDEPTKWRKTG